MVADHFSGDYEAMVEATDSEEGVHVPPAPRGSDATEHSNYLPQTLVHFKGLVAASLNFGQGGRR